MKNYMKKIIEVIDATFAVAKRTPEKISYIHSFGFRSDTTGLTFTFRFSPPLLFRFSCPSFFSFAGHLVGFTMVEKVFRKAVKILGLDERKR